MFLYIFFFEIYNFVQFVVPVKKKGLTSILLTSFQNSSSAQTASSSSSQPVNFIGKDRISFYSSKPRTNNFYTGKVSYFFSFLAKNSFHSFHNFFITTFCHVIVAFFCGLAFSRVDS